MSQQVRCTLSDIRVFLEVCADRACTVVGYRPQGANGEEGEREEATLPAEEAAPGEGSGYQRAIQRSITACGKRTAHMGYAQTLLEKFYDGMQAIKS